MREKDQFMREIEAREGLNENALSEGVYCVIPIICSLRADENDDFKTALSEAGFAEYHFLLVMPASEKSFDDVIRHDAVCCMMDKIPRIFRDIVTCVGTIHAKSRIHGDLKPLNVMRNVDGTINLIDLDASACLGLPCGLKFSSAYVPPEMIVSAQNGHLSVRSSASDPLLASASYDSWALGAMLYQLCTGTTLWKADVHDNLVDDLDLRRLSEWSSDTKEEKLSRLECRFARSLISQLLVKEPAKRPDIPHILSSAFLSGCQPVSRLPGQHAGFDVFLSYRDAADADIANRLYDELQVLALY